MSFTDFTPDTEHEEFKRQWDEDERGRALKSRDEAEDEWQRCGYVFARVEPEPDCSTAISWDVYARIPNPKSPGRRIVRLDLIGGGQIKVIERFEVGEALFGGPILKEPDGSERMFRYYRRPELRVTALCGDVIRRVRGCFRVASLRGRAAINCNAVVFPPGTDQAIADRTAATFRAIDYCPEHLFALLIGGQGCAFCNRPLRDELSRLIGVGQDCAEQYGIPHSRAAAEARLALRRRLLAHPIN